MACYHCPERVDSAEHTLAECHAWQEERMALRGTTGCDMILSNIVGVIVNSRDAWKAFQFFAEKVMAIKKEAERLRQIPAVGIDFRALDPERRDDESGSGG